MDREDSPSLAIWSMYRYRRKVIGLASRFTMGTITAKKLGYDVSRVRMVNWPIDLEKGIV
jgi:hypothetical protein